MPNNTLLLLLVAVVLLQTTYLTYRSLKRSSVAKNQSIFVDTSVLIDGRILPIAETGFVPGELVIPRSVIGELQFLADNADSEKRERARRGLDVVRELQDLATVTVSIMPDSARPEGGVDARLLQLATQYGGRLLTIDFNLIKVALVEDIPVLNINDLAKKLRMSYLPGDTLSIELTQQGSDKHQAVGHLDDGTMVVVEHANRDIGKTVDIEIIRSLQTSAGKMMFARRRGVEQSAETPVRVARQNVATIKKQTRQQPTVSKSTPVTSDSSPTSTDNTQAVAAAPRRVKSVRRPSRDQQASTSAGDAPTTVRRRPSRGKSNEDSLLRSIQSQ